MPQEASDEDLACIILGISSPEACPGLPASAKDFLRLGRAARQSGTGEQDTTNTASLRTVMQCCMSVTRLQSNR
jgi:hypothetical protein